MAKEKGRERERFKVAKKSEQGEIYEGTYFGHRKGM